MSDRADAGTVLAEALRLSAASTAVTDSHQAARRLERSMRRNHRRRVVLVVGAAAAAVAAVVGIGALASDSDRRAEPVPAESTQPPLPSPGHRIVFSGTDRIFVVSDRGETPVPVLAGNQPRFSPDGRRLAYVDREGRVAVATVGTWRERPLEDGPVPADREVGGGLVWSPDGTRLAYVDQVPDSGKGADLLIVDVASGNATIARHFPAPYVTAMDWSPDGARLVLGFDRSGDGGRMVVDTFDLEGGALTPLLRGGGETLGVRYSPDGSQIAFYSDSLRCICVSATDGTGVRTVLGFSGAEPDSARLAWSPDGTRLVWDERFGGRVSVLDVATGRTSVLTDRGGRAPTVDWDRPR
jgi:dipeptidyl aminopeptidase/acylaminoacyl peptidase